MLDWIRDPLWQFVGSLLAFIGILVSIYLFAVQRSVKSLAYDVIVQTPLLTVSEEMQGKIKILFDEKPVPNIHLLILKIFNDGNAAIATSDFEKPLRFYFGKDATILSAEVTKTTPDTFKPEVTFQPQHLEISPTLFNAGDLAIVKLLISQHDGSIKPDARIIGVKDMR